MSKQPHPVNDLLEAVGPFPPKYGREGLRGAIAPILPAHKTTTLRLGVASPFVVNTGSNINGAFIGQESGGGMFSYDPWEAYRFGHVTGTSMVCIGGVGSGKSGTNKTLCRGMVALGRKVFITNDPKGEWTAVTSAYKGQTITIGPGLRDRVNPLDAGHKPPDMDDKQWQQLVMARRRTITTTITRLLFEGQPMSAAQHTVIDLALQLVAERCTDPTLVDLYTVLNECPETIKPYAQHAVELEHAFRRLIRGDLSGMFDGPSTVRPNPNAPIISVDTSAMINMDGPLRYITAAVTAAWSDVLIQSSRDAFWLVVTEEGWSSMRDAGSLRTMDERTRLAGEWGLATMLIMHELADLKMVGAADSAERNMAEGLLSKAQTKIVHRQSVESISDTARVLGLTDKEAQATLHLKQGEALWKIGNRTHKVKTQWAPGEQELFGTDERRAG